MHREQIDAALAARLVAEQFPQWAGLPVVPVGFSGWDNRTFRLGDTMSVRLPSGAAYAGSVGKELTWLPRLAPHLPCPIPEPVAAGAPSVTFPWPWSIRRWIAGRPAATAPVADPVAFAEQLARFLRALQRIDPAGGPTPGQENFHRGGDLVVYDDETRRATAASVAMIDPDAVTEMWEAALAARWDGPPVWFHGDFAPGNLLLDGSGRLAGVIDFGQCGVGDPACDLVIAWTLLRGRARDRFRAAMAVDGAMWARGRGWALWKALSTLLAGDAGPYFIAQAHGVLRELRLASSTPEAAPREPADRRKSAAGTVLGAVVAIAAAARRKEELMERQDIDDELAVPGAQELLASTSGAHLAYLAKDGTPRVIPVGFYWTGDEFVISTATTSPKVAALSAHADVALSIDAGGTPEQARALSVRGRAGVEIVDGVVPEYLAAARKVMDAEAVAEFERNVRAMYGRMARIAITPYWVRYWEFGSGRMPRFLQELAEQSRS